MGEWRNGGYFDDRNTPVGFATSDVLEARAFLTSATRHLEPTEARARVEAAVRVLREGLPVAGPMPTWETHPHVWRVTGGGVSGECTEPRCQAFYTSLHQKPNGPCWARAYRELACMEARVAKLERRRARDALEAAREPKQSIADLRKELDRIVSDVDRRCTEIVASVREAVDAGVHPSEPKPEARVERLPSYQPSDGHDCTALGGFCHGCVREIPHDVHGTVWCCAAHVDSQSGYYYNRTTDPRDEAEARRLGVWGGA
jgi:hypothetical protein